MTNDHLSLDELAELDEGLLPPERTSAIRAHLHGCSECQAKVAAINASRDQLANLPPVTMPPDVIARLNDAIAAEREASAAAVPAQAGPSVVDLSARTSDVVPKAGTVSRPRFGRPSLPALAVAATFVLAGGAIVIGHLNHGSSPTVSDSAGTAGLSGGTNPIVKENGTATAANLTLSSTGQDYTPTALGTDIQGLLDRRTLTQVPKISPDPTPSSDTVINGGAAGGGGGSGPRGGAGTAGGSVRSGSGSGAKVKTKKSTHRVTGKPTTFSSVSSAPSPIEATEQTLNAPIPKKLNSLYHSKAKILSCAQFLTGSTKAIPLTVDFARWTDTTRQPPLKAAPAAVFVFTSSLPDRVAVAVTDPACDLVYSFEQVPLP